MADERSRAISEEELARIRAEAMDFANIGLYRYRFDGEILYFDRGALRLLDIEDRFADPADVVGMKIGELFEYVDPPERLREALRARRTLRDFEYRYRTLTGKLRWVYHNSYLVTDPETGEEQIQVIARDITALKRFAQALEASEQSYRALAEQSQQGIGVLQGNPLRLVFANRALAGILGAAETELVGELLEELLERVHRDDRNRLRSLLTSGSDAPGATVADVRIEDAIGSEH